LLPSGGVPNGDLFYVIVEDANCLVTTSTAGDATNVIAAGQVLYAETANGSTNATLPGRVVAHNAAGTFSAAQTTDGTSFKIILNSIGRAKSAKTTGQTAGDLLVDLCIKR